LLSKKFLYEVYKQISIKKINRSALAKLLQVSPGYLSQIFHSKKPLTFEMLIRFQQVLQIEFEIKAQPDKGPAIGPKSKTVLSI
jgi:transcriptional regulator with XRE-family HTH domain